MAAIFEIQPTANGFAGATAPSRHAAPLGVAPGPAVRQTQTRPRARRPRLMLAVLVGVVCITMLLVAMSVTSALTSPAVAFEAAGEFHVVSEGDTLYSVASSWDSETPVAEVIEQISVLNGGIDHVEVGDVISLPAAVR